MAYIMNNFIVIIMFVSVANVLPIKVSEDPAISTQLAKRYATSTTGTTGTTSSRFSIISNFSGNFHKQTKASSIIRGTNLDTLSKQDAYAEENNDAQSISETLNNSIGEKTTISSCTLDSPVTGESTALTQAYPFFNLNYFKGQDHDIKFLALFQSDRPEVLDYVNIKQELEDNTIQYDKKGNLTESMIGIMQKVKKGDKIYLLLHGWTDCYDSEYEISGVSWPIGLGGDLRQHTNSHVFLIDWSLHASTSYAITVYRTKIYDVAKVIMKFLEELRAYADVELNDFYGNIDAIGHSMGAQICGIIGYKIYSTHKVKLGIIYALDPAGLLFHLRIRFRSEDEFFHVDYKAAKKVLILHSTFESRIISLRYAVGHYDFYAFVMEGKQDWCKNDKSCKHMRAINLFKSSILQHEHIDDKLIGFKCDYYGRIGDGPTSQFGIHHNSNDLQGVYYIPIDVCSPHIRIVKKTQLPMKYCEIENKNTYAFSFIVGTRKTVVRDVVFKPEPRVPSNKQQKLNNISSDQQSTVVEESDTSTISSDIETIDKKAIMENSFMLDAFEAVPITIETP